MDVSDLKGLFAEVKKRMDAQHRARAARARRRAHRTRVGHHPRHRARRGLRLAGAAQPGGVAVDSRADDDRRAAVRPVADGRRSRKAIRASNLGLNPTNDGKVVRIPIPGADRRAPQGAVEARAQARRGGPQRRPPGPPRRERQAEEAAEGPRDLRRRRAPGPRRGAEDHRPAHRAASTSCRRRRTRSC